MAKVTAPLLSFGATGQIAKSMVLSKWRGIPVSRRYAVPSNPRTVEQQATRNAFSTANQMFLYLSGVALAPWTAYATGKPFVNRNAFVSSFVRFLRGEADFTNFQASPGARGGLPPASLALTPGTAEIDVALVTPEAPDGWTLVGTTWLAFVDGDPALGFNTELLSGQETISPDAFTITGLTGGEDYIVSVFLEWMKPNGQTAYSVSLTDTATPTA